MSELTGIIVPNAILGFRLPEERAEFEAAVHGADYLCVLQDLDQWLREQAKYHDRPTVPVDEVRDRLREIADERGVRLWE